MESILICMMYIRVDFFILGMNLWLSSIEVEPVVSLS